MRRLDAYMIGVNAADKATHPKKEPMDPYPGNAPLRIAFRHGWYAEIFQYDHAALLNEMMNDHSEL